MQKSIFRILAVLTLIPVLLFSGCIKKKDKESGDQSLNKVTKKGELVLGLDASFPPMGFKDENNKIVGFDIDVAKEVCSRMNIKLKTQPINWDSKEQELDAGNIDCIWNGMSYSEERAQKMTLSKPYMNNNMVLVVRKDSGYTTQADLKDKKIAVQNGSTAQTVLDASDFKKTVKRTISLKDNVSAFIELDMKTVDAVFVDVVVADYVIATNHKDYVILPDGLADEQYVIGFRKGDNALKDKIDATLIEMKKDGKLAEISNKWFGKDVTTVK